jgi:hypothetical protein
MKWPATDALLKNAALKPQLSLGNPLLIRLFQQPARGLFLFNTMVGCLPEAFRSKVTPSTGKSRSKGKPVTSTRAYLRVNPSMSIGGRRLYFSTSLRARLLSGVFNQLVVPCCSSQRLRRLTFTTSEERAAIGISFKDDARTSVRALFSLRERTM